MTSTTQQNEELVMITTLFKSRNSLPEGVISIDRNYVHLTTEYFLELFQNRGYEISERDSEFPFRLTTYAFGVKFVALSKERPKHPVEKLAEDLLCEWDHRDYKNFLGVYYADGSYILTNSRDIGVTKNLVYSYEQYESDESITLEQAILDHMEVVHNAK